MVPNLFQKEVCSDDDAANAQLIHTYHATSVLAVVDSLQKTKKKKKREYNYSWHTTTKG